MKESFLFYREWKTLIDSLPDEKRLKFYDLLFNFNGQDYNPKIEDTHLKAIFEFIIIKVKENDVAWQEKREKARQSANIRWGNANAFNRTKRKAKNANLKNAIHNVNVNDNVNDNVINTKVNSNDINNTYVKSQSDIDPYVAFFNNLTSRNFKTFSSRGKRQLEFLKKQGYKLVDFEKVIKNIYADSHHSENNFKWATPEFSVRPDIFERFHAINDQKEMMNNKASEESKRKKEEIDKL